MAKKGSIQMVGPYRSDLASPFTVFEHFSGWESLRIEKVLGVGMYFAVLITEAKSKIDINPDLFIQEYRPHSSGSILHVQTRRYGEFVPYAPDIPREKHKDDIVFSQVQLYQVISELSVELILRDGSCAGKNGSGEIIQRECQTKKGIQRLVDRICAEQSFVVLGDLKQRLYYCPVSSGYFLAMRKYRVWSVLVGKNTGFSYEKKVLIMDYYTGIPSVVEYNDRHFEKPKDI